MPVDQNEETAFTGTSRFNAVHFPVASTFTVVDFRGTLLDAATIGQHFAALGDMAPFCLAGPVTELPFWQDDYPIFEVVVDRALTGEVYPLLSFETMDARGDGVAYFKVFDQLIGELVGHDASRALIGLQIGGHALGQQGGILRINPPAVHLVFQEHAREATFQLTFDASLRKPVMTGEFVHGQDVSAMFEIFIPQAFQRLSSFHRPMCPRKRESANIGHVSVLSR